MATTGMMNAFPVPVSILIPIKNEAANLPR